MLSLVALLASACVLQHPLTPAPSGVPASTTAAIPQASRPGPLFQANFPTWRWDLAVDGDTGTSQRPKAIEYSDLYYTRAAIHHYASYATIPLFVAEFAIGQSLYNQTAPTATVPASESLRSWHSLVAGGVVALFAVNTITGTWNLWDSRKAKEGRTRRYVHSALMFLADVGFVATGALAPSEDDIEGQGDPNARSKHRAVAVSSMVTALAGYLMMFIGNR